MATATAGPHPDAAQPSTADVTPAGPRTGRRAGIGSVAFRTAFVLYAAGLACWLVLGLLPTLADIVPAFRSWLGQLAAGGGPAATAAGRILHPDPSMTPVPAGRALLQYGFSVLNFGLGMLLAIRTRGGQGAPLLVPRLLAFALLGTAATFNEPSHRAFHITGSPWPIALVHFTFHVVSGVTYLWAVLLFPDGTLPRRWRLPAGFRSIGITVVSLAVAAIGWQSSFLSHPQFFVVFFGIGVSLAGVAATALRLTDPHNSPAGRATARLLWASLLPGLAVALFWCGSILAWRFGDGSAATLATRAQQAFPAAFAVVPVVLFAVVARYRLWDIDRLLGRVLIYGALAAAVSACYVAAVTAGGLLVGGSAWWLVLALSVIAVAVDPARRLAGRLVNRLVYGQQIEPAQAMAELLSGLQHLTPVDVLAQLARVTVRATRARAIALYAVDGRALVRVARAPAMDARSAGPAAEPLPQTVTLAAPVDGQSLPPDVAADLGAATIVPVRYAGEVLGVLAAAGPDPLTARDHQFLADIAGHAGLLLHNALLTELLEEHVVSLARNAERLQTARRTLVAAQDAERERLERNLHDGVQQYLVAAIISLRGRDGDDRASGILRAARQDLRLLAGGARPAALAGGLSAALARSAELVRQAGIPVTVSADIPAGDDGPGWAEVEEAAYYCCVEALQNVLKHAMASWVTVQVSLREGDLALSVIDNGRGFDTTGTPDHGLDRLAGRVGALGGWVAVESAPDGGTRLLAHLPVRAPRPSDPATTEPSPGTEIPVGEAAR